MKKRYYLLLLITALANAQILNISDVNFKAKLLAANSGNFIARNTSGDYFKIDADNDGEIQLSEALTVGSLNISNANIDTVEGLESFLNLNSLLCNGNHLTLLPLGALSHLTIFDCSENNLTELDCSQTNVNYFECYNNQITWINMKNNQNQIFPAEMPGRWMNNPLLSVCADQGELLEVNTLLDLNGYQNLTASSDCFLSIQEQGESLDVAVSPNPSNGRIQVKANQPVLEVALYDLQGRLLKTQAGDTTPLFLELFDQAKGIYLLQVQTPKIVRSIKVIKE